MEPLHAVFLTVGLFVITFFNPGANLFVVVQTSLASGRRAGVLTGLGVALGDAFYSGLGLFGMATLITQSAELFAMIKIAGGAYLLWFAWNSIRHQDGSSVRCATSLLKRKPSEENIEIIIGNLS